MRALITVCFASLLTACGLLTNEDVGPCRPVDVGGECFAPSHEAFVEHAMTSAGAWPQLDGLKLSADRVIEGLDLSQDSVTWLVPLLSGGRMVAISRFVPVGEAVQLGEVALLEQPLDPLPAEFPGTLVLYVDIGCAEDPTNACLFNDLRWAVRLADGTYRLPEGTVVEKLPVRNG